MTALYISNAMNMLNAVARESSHSPDERETVPNTSWKKEETLSGNCAIIVHAIAMIEILFERNPMLKTDLHSDRQFRTLNSWKKTNVVNAIVLLPEYRLKACMKTLQECRQPSSNLSQQYRKACFFVSIFSLGFRGGRDMYSFPAGSMPSESAGGPSTMMFIQRS